MSALYTGIFFHLYYIYWLFGRFSNRTHHCDRESWLAPFKFWLHNPSYVSLIRWNMLSFVSHRLALWWIWLPIGCWKFQIKGTTVTEQLDYLNSSLVSTYPPMSALYTGLCFHSIQLRASLMGLDFQQGVKILNRSHKSKHHLNFSPDITCIHGTWW